MKKKMGKGNKQQRQTAPKHREKTDHAQWTSNQNVFRLLKNNVGKW